MYFTRETQARILNRFHFAMRDGGDVAKFLDQFAILARHQTRPAIQIV